MKTFSHLKVLASMSCALALAACDSIKDVPNEDAASLPPETVVLSGQIYGLSSLRSITLQNNDDAINTRSFINATPSVPNEGVRPVPFSFGAIQVGTPYNITVKEQPVFKNCTVSNGQGVLTLGARPNVVVTCTNTNTRYDLSVHIPSDPSFFKGLPGAKVRVTTEEEIREVEVTADTPSPVIFEDVLISGTGTLNPSVYTVQASTFEGNRINKCVVTLPSGSNPAGNIATPVVGDVPVAGGAPSSLDAQEPACSFTIGGKVGYSLPPGENAVPGIAGLRLQLRDLQNNSAIDEIDVGSCSPVATTATTAQTTTLGATVPVPGTVTSDCSYEFNTPVRSSSTQGLYEVAVVEHPVGQHCIVVNGGSVSVFTLGLVSPVSVTNANVFCRANPAAEGQLRGVFRLRSTTFVANSLTGTAPQTSTWEPFDMTKQNTASSNMMALFENGTFLYGTHANATQVEHGFYDYDPAAQTLRFTLIVDTDPSAVFPANFSPIQSTNPAGPGTTQITHILTTTPGISALPNPIRRNGTTAARTVTGFANLHAAMTEVTLGSVQRALDNGTTNTLRTISGTFGADADGIATYQVRTTGSCTAAAPCIDPNTGASIIGTTTTPVNCSAGAPCYSPNFAQRVSWTLEEPPQVMNEMTGAWVTQDSRRLWVWDYRTYYGTGVGVLGGSPSMNDACFSNEDLHAPSGIYTRRGTLTGCFPFARPGVDPESGLPGISVFGSTTPRNGNLPAYSASTGRESVDFSLSTAPLVNLPGFNGRVPGGEPALQTQSPSPVYYHVAPAASFFNSASAIYFPAASTAWCNTEILGLRLTSNGFPIDSPIYFCRTGTGTIN